MRVLTHKLPHEDLEESSSVSKSKGVMHEPVGRLHTPPGILHHLLKGFKAVAPMNLSTRVLLSALLDLTNHPFQRNVTHLQPVIVEICAGLIGLPSLDGVLESAPERHLLDFRLGLIRTVFLNKILLGGAE